MDEVKPLLTLVDNAATVDARHLSGAIDGRAVLALLVGASAAGLEVVHDVDALERVPHLGRVLGLVVLHAVLLDETRNRADLACALVGLAERGSEATARGHARHAGLGRDLDTEGGGPGAAERERGALAVDAVRAELGAEGDGVAELADTVALDGVSSALIVAFDNASINTHAMRQLAAAFWKAELTVPDPAGAQTQDVWRGLMHPAALAADTVQVLRQPVTVLGLGGTSQLCGEGEGGGEGVLTRQAWWRPRARSWR